MLPPFPDLGHIKKMETRRYPLKSWQNPSEEPLRCSLVFPLDIKGRRVLLGRKKRGFGIGLWNGFGGKLDQGETMDQCVIRELYEECGLIPDSGGIYEVGRMMILRPSSSPHASSSSSDLSSLNPSDPISPTSSSPLNPSNDSQTGFTRETKHRRYLVNAQTIDISIYICSSWSGEITESEEMFPQWFELSNSGSSGLPLDLMWPEAKLFLPTLLRSQLRPPHSSTFPEKSDVIMTEHATSPSSQVKRGIEQLAIWTEYSWIPGHPPPHLVGQSLRREECGGEIRHEGLTAWWVAWHETLSV